MIRFEMRLTPEMDEYVRTASERLGISKSDIMREGVVFIMTNDAALSDLMRLKQLRDAKKNMRYTRSLLYQIKNVMRAVLDITASSFMMTGKLNIKMVSRLVNDFNILYDAMPDDIKEMMKEEFTELQKWKDEDYLSSKMQRYKQLAMVVREK